MRHTITLLFATLATARADTPKPAPAAPVDLLHASHAVVAVSSSVVSASYKPEHLVDGKLDTAWNSKTGDSKAWLAVRVPADAKVATIKLTVGFTAIDKKLGDLFTQNPRIKKVRVSRANVLVVEKTLDTTSRALQDIAIDGPGGDYLIEVTELQAGTKYKETCMSELEVWGTIAKPSSTPLKPAVRVGSLDKPEGLDRATCMKALFPDGGTAFSASSSPIGKAFICDVESTGPNAHLHDIAIVANGKPLADRITVTAPYNSNDSAYAAVTATPFPLTSDEAGVLVELAELAMNGPGGHDRQTLYRVTKTGLGEILAFDAYDYGPDRIDDCDLAIGAAHAPLPDLDISCTNKAMDGTDAKQRVDHYRWNGSKYAKR